MFRQLYHSLTGYEGDSLFRAVLLPFLEQAVSDVMPQQLENFRRLAKVSVTDDEEDMNAAWELYALGRVNDFLLLPFQNDEQKAWTGSRASFRQYLYFFLSLGMTPVTCDKFSPFYYEIVRVDQADDPAEPIHVLEHFWPGLKFGEMMFSRSGVHVRGGTQHIVKEVAESSTLYFTHRRLRRRTEDLAMGWGSNSQWRTDYRRDYEANGKRYYNSQGENLLVRQVSASEDRDGLTPEERLELCRNRCFIRTRRDNDTDLWPYDDRWVEPA